MTPFTGTLRPAPNAFAEYTGELHTVAPHALEGRHDLVDRSIRLSVLDGAHRVGTGLLRRSGDGRYDGAITVRGYEYEATARRDGGVLAIALVVDGGK